MSSWGNLDNVTASGTVTAYAGNNLVNGNTTFFLSNVKDGDYVIITGTKFQVANIASNTVLYLTSSGKAASGATMYIQQGPKYIANVAPTENVYTIQNVYGVDRLEIANASPAANSTPHTGWVHYNTYTTSQGMTRRKAEVLVAMSKNFNANVTGHLQTDAADNSVYPQ